MNFREFSEAYNNYLMHSGSKAVHKTFLYKGMTPQDYVDELLLTKTREEAIENLNSRWNATPRYNPREIRFFTECLKILQNN